MWQSDLIEWRRRKEYLIRSMFQDMPLLSPVPEEEESFDSPRLHRSYSSYRPYPPQLPPERLSEQRPYSPLPPLIIELAPIINLHDEPEEYYIQLEKKMLRVYRRMFLENRSDISNYLTDGEGSSFESNDAAEHTQSDTRRGLKRSSSSETDASTRSKKSKSDDDISSSSDVVPKTSEDDFNCEESSISSDDGRERNGTDEESDSAEEEQYIKDRETDETDMSESRDCIQVTFQADVHREVDQNDDDLADVNNEAEHNDDLANKDQEIELLENNAVSETNPTGSRPSPCDQVLDQHDDDMADVNNEAELNDDLANKDQEIELLENNAVSETNPNGSRPGQEVEIMRTPRIYPSIGSLLGDLGVNNTDIDTREHIAIEDHITKINPSTAFEDYIDRSSENSMDYEINMDVLAKTSSEDNLADNNSAGVDVISSSSSHSHSTKYQDEGVQTSLGYEEQNKDILKNMFVGMPRVFRLCHCINHVCSC